MSTTDQDYRGGVLTSKEVPGSVEQYARALEYERGEVLRAIDEIDRLKRELDKAREANRLAIHTGLKQEALIAELWASQEAREPRFVQHSDPEMGGMCGNCGEHSSLHRENPKGSGLCPEPATPHEPSGWQPIKTAPTDGTVILVYAPRYQDLPAMQSLCAWHPDAGFCIDELRTPTHWMPIPSAPVTKGETHGNS